MNAVYNRSDFGSAFDVSRETVESLEWFEQLLLRWNPRINLIAKSTETSVWTRHFADSAQLWPLAKSHSGRWVDLGSGGGFPGLVIAIIARQQAPALETILVESDARKSAFLISVIAGLSLNARVLTERAETLDRQQATTISARALAPLRVLFPILERHLAPGGECLLLKGAGVESELTEVSRIWDSRVEKISSRTDVSGTILRIGDIRRA